MPGFSAGAVAPVLPLYELLPDVPVLEGSAAKAGPLRSSIARPAAKRTAVRFMRVSPLRISRKIGNVPFPPILNRATRVPADDDLCAYVEEQENARRSRNHGQSLVRAVQRMHRNSYTTKLLHGDLLPFASRLRARCLPTA